MVIPDNPRRYGAITRCLHWVMAALLLWQFGGMVLKDVIGRTPLTKFWVGSHASIGALLLTLLIVRVIWALSQQKSRPRSPKGMVGSAARLGHIGLYCLMLIVPSLGLLRMIGSGKGVTLFGVPLLPASGVKTEWMVAPANLVHGTLAWILLILIVGHIVMVLIHHFVWRDDIARRMISRSAS